MSKLYVVATKGGKVRANTVRLAVRHGAKSAETIAQMAELWKGSVSMPFEMDMGSVSAAELARRLVAFKINFGGSNDTLYAIKHPDDVWDVAPKNEPHLIDIVRQAGERVEGVGDEVVCESGSIWKTIRVDVLQVTMLVMSKIGNVSESQISRFEAGTQVPDWRFMARIRAFAIEVGLKWKDEMFFKEG